MNDRGLLEMAARAAGIGPKLCYESARNCLRIGDRKSYWLWSPLSDDGDALRLAVRLQLQIRPNDYDVMVVAHLPAHITVAEVCDHKDPYAATRRAIVRAAAEIGRAMTTESVR